MRERERERLRERGAYTDRHVQTDRQTEEKWKGFREEVRLEV